MASCYLIVFCVCICEVVEIFSLLGHLCCSLDFQCLVYLASVRHVHLWVFLSGLSPPILSELCVLLRLALKTFCCVDFECVGQFRSSTLSSCLDLWPLQVCLSGRMIIFKFLFYLFLHSSMSYFHVMFCAVSYLAPQEPKWALIVDSLWFVCDHLWAEVIWGYVNISYDLTVKNGLYRPLILPPVEFWVCMWVGHYLNHFCPDISPLTPNPLCVGE